MNLALVNKAVGHVNPAMILGGRILRLTLRFAIRGAEKEDIFLYFLFLGKAAVDN